MSPSTWLWLAVSVCVALAIWDPAERFKGWKRSHRRASHAAGWGKPSIHQEGAVPVVAAPSPVLVCGCEVLADRPLVMTDAMVLGHYLSQASKAPMVRA